MREEKKVSARKKRVARKLEEGKGKGGGLYIGRGMLGRGTCDPKQR